jgi:DNA modification methylase
MEYKGNIKMKTKKTDLTEPLFKKIRLSTINPAEYNPRVISDDALAGLQKSLKRFGCVEPIIVNIRDDRNVIVGGHQRHKALTELHGGNYECTCVVVDLSVSEEKTLNVTLNNPHIQGDFIDTLSEYIEQLRGEIPEQDYLDLAIIKLRGEIAAVEGLTDEDAIPEPPKVAVTKPGDLYLLGGHRLLCGDSTKAEDVERLMNGKKADMIFTDPPYNVAYVGGTEEQMTIKNDAMTEAQYIAFMGAFFTQYKESASDNAAVYICHASQWQRETESAMLAAGIEVRCQIVWVKNTFAWGFGRYKFRHEPIFYAHIKDKPDNWYGDKTQNTVWEEKKPSANRLHPTMKPVEIVERALVNSSKAGDLVLDLFMGSGTTLIACHKNNRISYGMELDPIYCDVIVKRWEEFTGKKAKRITCNDTTPTGAGVEEATQ